MKVVYSFLIVAISLWAAEADAASKRDLRGLLERIEFEIRNYDQSPDTLEQTRAHLSDALATLRGRAEPDPEPVPEPTPEPSACRGFAVEEYLKDGFSNSSAMEMARDYCNRAEEHGSSLDVIRAFHGYLLKDGYSRRSSLDYALAIGRHSPESSLRCVRSAMPRFRRDGLSYRSALEKSVDYCSTI